MRKLLAIAALTLSMNALAEFPESLPAPGEHAVEFVSTWDDTTQPALLFVPSAADSGEPLPLLVALHGKGVDHTAWFRLTPVMEKAEDHGYVVVTPHGRGDLWYRGPGEQDVLDVIDNLVATGRIDPDRVYLAGHSMGGWGTWWIGLRNADRFASIAPMAGLPPMDLLPNALHLDPYIIHDRDDDIVSVELSRKPAARLAELGISHRYVETTGYGHASKLIGDSLDDVFEWFSARRRVSDPKRILIAARTPAKASNGRLRIVATDEALETAEVEVEWLGNPQFTPTIREHSLLNIKTRNVGTIAISSGFPSLDPLKVDGQLIDTLDSSRLVILPSEVVPQQAHLTKTNGNWSAYFVRALPPPMISRASVSPELEAELSTATRADVTRRLGGMVAQAAGVDGMIARNDAFAWLGSPLTPDRLVDSYVSAAETVGFYQLRGGQVTEILAADSALVLAGLELSELELELTYSIIAPLSPLVKHEALREPHDTAGPVYKYLLQALEIDTWK